MTYAAPAVHHNSVESSAPIVLHRTEGDHIFGLAGNDLLNGTERDDTILGGNGHDTLKGNGGNDHLIGGAGDDVLYGGGNIIETAIDGSHDNAQGSDTFLFNASFGRDSIGFYACRLPIYGIDASDILEFTDSSHDLYLLWHGNHLTIIQDRDHDGTDDSDDQVTICAAIDVTSDGGFTIRWNGLIERIDGTTDTTIDGR